LPQCKFGLFYDHRDNEKELSAKPYRGCSFDGPKEPKAPGRNNHPADSWTDDPARAASIAAGMHRQKKAKKQSRPGGPGWIHSNVPAVNGGAGFGTIFFSSRTDDFSGIIRTAPASSVANSILSPVFRFNLFLIAFGRVICPLLVVVETIILSIFLFRSLATERMVGE
jgi:hypothetical protein